MGCCLLTDHKSDIRTLFEPDHEILTYKCADEAVSKAKFLIANPMEAKKIARAGQKRTFRQHTTENQVEHLVDYLNSLNN
jgi:spore maturation protein CgeB